MNDDLNREFGRITELGKARSDEYTERVLAFVQDIETSCPEPFIPLLTDIALVRALIVLVFGSLNAVAPPIVHDELRQAIGPAGTSTMKPGLEAVAATPSGPISPIKRLPDGSIASAIGWSSVTSGGR